MRGHHGAAALENSDKAHWNDEIVDKAVKEHCNSIQDNLDTHVTWFEGKPWQLWLNRKKGSTKPKGCLLEHTCSNTARGC